MKKNEEYIVDIIDNGMTGEGIAKIDNFTIFVPDAIVGEKVKIKIVKVLSSHGFGKIIDILQESEYRNESDCDTYSRCGGCDLRHINYDYTLKIKENKILNLLKKEKLDIKVNNCIEMDNPHFYRNKLQYPFGTDNSGNPVMGVFAKRSHDVIKTQNCNIQDKLCQEIANYIFDFLRNEKISVYDEKRLNGLMRHIIVRIGKKTNEVMIILVTNKGEFDKLEELVKGVVKKYPEVKTIVRNINSKNTNVILGSENKIVYGKGYIYDELLGYKFKISPMSFYQVNPVQTEKLYSKAIEYAELTGNETIFDLYCGIGTIGICASGKAKKLYGIETIEDAIKDAKENAKLNNIKNAEFFVGDVEKELPEFLKREKISPDVVFLDPPRKGCEKIVLDTLMKIKPKKIVYISCNPATFVRDIKLLQEKYEANEITPVDMFPYTNHVECVAVLQLKENRLYLILIWFQRL